MAEREPGVHPAADPELLRRMLDGAPLVVATVDAADAARYQVKAAGKGGFRFSDRLATTNS